MLRVMSRTPSTMQALGTPAPPFSLSDTVSGGTIATARFAGKPLLIAFICNHCPYVKHISSVLAAMTAEYLAKGVAVIGISSNDATTYPNDGPQAMKAEALAAGYRFPYCYDSDQRVAKAYHAACTPDFFLFDRQHRLTYRGQFDGSRPKEQSPLPVTGADLRAALDAVLTNAAPITGQKPSAGCNIKWKPGNEPAYASA